MITFFEKGDDPLKAAMTAAGHRLTVEWTDEEGDERTTTAWLAACSGVLSVDETYIFTFIRDYDESLLEVPSDRLNLIKECPLDAPAT